MVALLALNESHARELIAKLVKECSAGISDREDEALKIADKWTLDESWVRDDFAEARDLAKSRKALEAAAWSEELAARGREIAAAANSRKAELEPKPEPKAQVGGEILEGPYRGQTLQRGRILGTKPKAEPEPEAQPEPEGAKKISPKHNPRLKLSQNMNLRWRRSLRRRRDCLP
jgi:hypothetical protein